MDIKRGAASSFTRLHNRVNLDVSFSFHIPYIKLILKYSIVSLLIVYMAGGAVFAPTGGVFAAQTDEERRALEAELADLESQIASHEATIAGYKQQGMTLKAEIDRLTQQIQKLTLQIRAVNLTLAALDSDIAETQSNIAVAEEQLTKNRENLVMIFRALYENDNKGVVSIFLQNLTIADVSAEVNDLLAVQDAFRATIERIADERQKLIDEKQVLAIRREDAMALKAYQDAQRVAVQATQKEKDALLAATKGEESRYQAILQETKQTAAQIRSRIFQLMGGGEMTFEQAYQFAKMAESATGVRAAFLLAILEGESALGRNVGRCTYRTAMHPTRDIPHFLTITAELGLDPETMMVSCPITSDGAYGGAMGPSQFIPSTWMIYTKRVSEITGNVPASPWRNADAFVATGLYIKDSMTTCRATYSRQTDIERCAAARYYAGSRWRTYLWTYGDRTLTRASRFEADIQTILASASEQKSAS